MSLADRPLVFAAHYIHTEGEVKVALALVLWSVDGIYDYYGNENLV